MLLRFAACLAFAVLAAAPAARADALPMPVPVDEFQQALVGVWREEPGQSAWGRGHGFIQRTIIVGNTDIVVSTFGGISYSNEYTATTMVGRWSATRVDDKTVKLTLTQSQTRGTELTLTFDGENSFLFTDAEGTQQPTRFTRVGEKIKVQN